MLYCVFHKLAQGHPALRAPWWTGSIPYINKLVASHMGCCTADGNEDWLDE